MKFRRRIVSALILFLVASAALRGQTPQGNLSFDVATVKPAAPLDIATMAADMRAGRMPKIGPQIGASRATYTHMSLADLIALAFNMRAYQISGPEWLVQELFDIEATIPEGATKDDVPAMLRALLEERFKLVAHQAQGEHKVLALVVGKSGVKMKESPTVPQAFDPNSPLQPGERQVDEADGPTRMKIDSDGTIAVNMGAKGTIIEKIDGQSMTLDMKSSGVTMDGFAELLSSIFLQMGGANSRQVVDMTGLKGYYQVDVKISIVDMTAQARSQSVMIPERPSSGSAATNAPPTAGVSEPTAGLAVFDSVERLGLKLEDRKATVDRLVIDRVERTPTEN